MNLSELLNISVLSLYEGELLGVVDKLYFDKKLKKLMEIELIGENDTRLRLPTKNIYHIGKNAITVKNNQAVSLKVEESALNPAPLNFKAYSIKGEFLGVVKEISLSEKFLTEKFVLDNGTTLEIKNLASSGKNTIIFYDQLGSVNVHKFVPNKTPKIFKTPKPTIANVMPIDYQTKQEEIIEKVETNEKTNAVIIDEKKETQNADFLLGRVCTKDIFNFNNEILIKAHGIINKKNLKEINKYGKLRELMLFSK
ncbi:MAG TPA: hypothetical protein IAB72_02290 [Candidatus Onthoplasma faecipullorum]|nr:hypothetical protein [Candidatus Onthoplasma faecipullorum]